MPRLLLPLLPLRITRDIDLSNAVALACGGDDIHVEPSLS